MHRAYRCPCSVKALEAFVRDVAGLELRQRPNTVSFRNLSTGPALAIRPSLSHRLVPEAHTTGRSVDDAFVPFDFKLEQKHDLGHDQSLRTETPLPLIETETPAPFDPLEEPKDTEDFEPEVVVHLGDARVAGQTATPQAPEILQTIDAIAFPDLLLQEDTANNKNKSQRLDILMPRTREENRKERKMRRLLAKQEEEATVATGKKKAKTPKKQVQKKAKTITVTSPEDIEVASVLASATSLVEAKSAKDEAKAAFVKKRREDRIAERKAKAEEKRAEEEQMRKDRLKEKESWQIQKAALMNKFGEQKWSPRKRISPDALAGIRALHAKSPDTYSTAVLAEHFKVPAEAVRRILKSKWQPNEDESEERRRRWEKRGERKWTEMAEQGLKPPKKWREMGVGKAEPGGLPAWKVDGKAGERWIDSVDPDRFVVAGDIAAEEDMPEPEGDGLADRIL